MANLGTALIEATVLSSPPNLRGLDANFSFDVHAGQIDYIRENPVIKPLFIETINSETTPFSAWGLEPRHYWIDNGLIGQDDPVKWNPIDMTAISSTQNPILFKKITEFADGSEGKTQVEPDIADPFSSSWTSTEDIELPVVNDRPEIIEFINATGLPFSPPPIPSKSSDDELANTRFVEQTRVEPGLIWGARTELEGVPNQPFYVTIFRDHPPSTENFENFTMISWGNASEEGSRFDLIIDEGESIRLYDHAKGDVVVEVDSLSIDPEVERIDVLVRTIAGFLVVTVNDYILVHIRTNEDGSGESGELTEEITLPSTNFIAVIGSNRRAKFNLHAPTYAQLGAVALMVPIPEGASSVSESGTGIFYDWSNYDQSGDEVSIVEMPSAGESPVLGVDCSEVFIGSGLGEDPSSIVGRGFHNNGEIRFLPSSVVPNYKASSGIGFILVLMLPENSYTYFGVEVPNSGTPYYFRSRGIADGEKTDIDGPLADLGQFVIDASVSIDSDDYFHVKRSATITCYNPGGQFNSLLNRQACIRLGLGWDSIGVRNLITGITTNVRLEEEAGRELIVISIEDYSHALENIPIINSPFYDGMLGAEAIKDLAKRGGIDSVSVEGFTNDFFLPAAYTYTAPAHRYPGEQMLMECIIDICKRFEGTFYFDALGNAILKRLPGGLLSDGPSIASFQTQPDASNPNNIVVGNYGVDFSYADVMNVISTYTVDRTLRTPIFVTTSASASANKLLYKRTFLYNQALLGDAVAAQEYNERLAQRMFTLPRKTSFQILSTNQFFEVLDIVDVDNLNLRVLGLSYSYSADSNLITIDFDGEWLGG